jgi:hypothetical protein
MKTIYKYIFVLFLAFSYNSTIYGTEFVRLIDSLYQRLDTSEYISNMKKLVYKDLENQSKEMDNTALRLYGEIYEKFDSITKMHLLDSIRNKQNIFAKKWIMEKYNDFIFHISNKSNDTMFLLNLHVEKDTTKDVTSCYSLAPDTSKMCFNIFFLDKNSSPDYVIYVENGNYCEHGLYGSFSRKLVLNTPKAYRKVIKKCPKYLLRCYELEQMNTILYVLNNKIYVYRIIEKEEYELNDYLEKFVDKKRKDEL